MAEVTGLLEQFQPGENLFEQLVVVIIGRGRSGELVRATGHSLTYGSPSSMLNLEFAQLSDRGKVRKQNEDFLGSVIPTTEVQARSRGWLFALADGVGGHGGGEVASRLAVETVCAGFQGASTREPHRALLPRLLQTANTAVFDAGVAAGRSGPGMATTLVACALRSDRAVVCHVGDSRCYLVRRGHGEVLTRDHTVANDQIRVGLLSKKEAEGSPMQHMLSRSLGGDLFVAADVSEHELLPGDVLVLCSDGLHGAVPRSEIEWIISDNRDLNVAAKELVASANQRDGSDNISVQLIRVRTIERIAMYRGRPYQLH